METENDFGANAYKQAFAPILTKRELFAAMAMQGLCADPNIENVDAKCCVKLADELIEELNK